MKNKVLIILLTVSFLAFTCFAKAVEAEVKEEGYIDIPEDHYARQAVEELVEADILPPGRGKKFHGEELVNRYMLVDLISKIVEKIVIGEEGELEVASPVRAYKDVPVNYYAYRSIQKLIALGVIPSGNRRELFYGDRNISRYQMVFFAFSAIEHVLSDVIDFKEADSSLGYGDVPSEHFVYETIQKLIWLGVLGGGQNNRFFGEEYVNRYELCYFMVNLIKAIFIKLKEIEEVVYEKPVEYGFSTFLNTSLSATQFSNLKAPGEDLIDLNAYQSISISIDRSLSEILSAFASFTSEYYFGDALPSSSSYIDAAYISFYDPPYALQIGRTNFYQGYTPFGNSLFIDTASADMLLGNYDHGFFNLYSAIGKLAYLADVSLDSNFGFLSLRPKLPEFLNWMDILVGSSSISNLPDPTFTFTLPGSVTQVYGGLKINLFNLFEFSAETAGLDFSDKSALPVIGYSTKEGFDALQCSLTYYSEDYGYSLSLGYQKIGDDFYLSTLARPASLLGIEQDTESLLIGTRFYPSPSQTVGADLAYVVRNGYNINTGVNGYYNLQLFNSAYLNLSMTKIMDNTSAALDQLNLSSSFSVSF